MAGSLTVEAVMLFPIVFLLFIAMLQCGLYLTYTIWGQSLAEQGVLLYQDSLQAGDTPTQATARAEAYLEEKLQRSGLEDIDITIEEKNRILYRTIHIQLKGRYSLLYSAEVTGSATGDYRESRKVRDTMEVIAEVIRRIPGFSTLLQQYKETIAGWGEWIK